MVDVGRMTLVRHGEAKYNQLESNLLEADDLTSEGVKVVTANFHEIGREHSSKSSLAFFTSPLARTLQTTQIGKTILSGYIDAQIPIEIVPELREVKNFDWKLFVPLVNGGQAEYYGRKFQVDKSLTNPQEINPENYFNTDEAHKLSERARASLPKDYLLKIDSFETAVDVEKRARKVITEIGNSGRAKYALVVSHAALIGNFVGDYTNGRSKTIKPGNYIILERNSSGFKPRFMKNF